MPDPSNEIPYMNTGCVVYSVIVLENSSSASGQALTVRAFDP
jgi:hypothetical protein